jgi:CRISPR-associated endonuclease Csn1
LCPDAVAAAVCDRQPAKPHHRHHAVDACVIAVTDQGLLQRFAQASASAREKQLDKLVETMPLPWPTYRDQVERAIHNILVSHKPDHGYEGAMMEATAYGIRKDGSIKQKTKEDGSEGRGIKNLIRISEPTQLDCHGIDTEGKPLPYIGYVGGSNYCIEVVRNDKGKWEGEVISTFAAYQVVRQQGEQRLRHPTLSMSGKPLVMRLLKGDCVRIDANGRTRLLCVVKIDPSTNIVFAEVNEAGELKKRHNDNDDTFRYVNLRGESLRQAKARRVTISPTGELRDPGFKE